MNKFDNFSYFDNEFFLKGGFIVLRINEIYNFFGHKRLLLFTFAQRLTNLIAFNSIE